MEAFEGWVHMLHYPTSNCIPYFVIPVLFHLCYSHQPLYHEFKKASCKHSSQMTWKEGRSPTKACLWPFCDVLLVACFVASDWLHASANAIRHWKSFQVTGYDRLSLGSFCCPRVTLIPSRTSMWNWGHMARASVSGAGGNSWLWIAVGVCESDGRDEAWQD